MKKIVTKSGQSAKAVKVYKFAEQLGFLKKIFDERESKTNIEYQDDEAETQQFRREEDIDQQNIISNDEETPIVAVQTDADPNQSSNQTTHKRRIQQISSVSKKRTTPQQSSASAQLMQYLINTKSQEPPPSTLTTCHPVDAFLAGISATLKTLNPYYLNLAKSEIFNTVQKYEMKMISSESLRDSQFSNLPSPCDITQTSGHFSNTSTRISTPMPSPDPVIDQHHHIADNHRFSSDKQENTLQNYFHNYQDL